RRACEGDPGASRGSRGPAGSSQRVEGPGGRADAARGHSGHSRPSAPWLRRGRPLTTRSLDGHGRREHLRFTAEETASEADRAAALADRDAAEGDRRALGRDQAAADRSPEGARLTPGPYGERERGATAGRARTQAVFQRDEVARLRDVSAL